MPSLLAAAVAALTLAAGPTTLKGGGVEVTLDLGGFAQDLGAGLLHDAYYRLGQFSLPEKTARAQTGGKPLVMSVLVDEVPPNVDLGRLRAHVLRTTPDPKPEVTAISAPPGFWLSYRQEFPQGLTQWHLYFHTLHEGKWVELHFSSLGRSPNTNTAALEKLALEVVRSVRVARKRTKA